LQHGLEDRIVVLGGIDALQLGLRLGARLLQRITEHLVRGARVHGIHGLDLARALHLLQEL
jgi:hypothetical protein